MRDGDRVRASGVVVAVPGRPVRTCRTYLLAEDGHGTPPCRELGVSTDGADLDRTEGLRAAPDGTRWGYAGSDGTYPGRHGDRHPPGTAR